ncbi:MAG: HlyD family secretion protein [Chthoniobacteraceae bacterium]
MQSPTSPEPAASEPRPAKPFKRLLALGLLIIAVAAGALYYKVAVAPYESTDNAFIEGHVTPVAPQIPGRVIRLLVEDNQEVKRGETLLEIDPSDYQVKVTQAQAGLAAAKSRLEQAKAQLSVDEAMQEQARAGLTAVEAESSRAQAELKRYQSVESRAVSRSQVDVAETQARSAAAQVEVARAKVLGAEAQLGLGRAGLQSAAADIAQAEAALRQAELNLSYTKLVAPDDGRVTRRSVEQGAYVQPGQALLAIVPHRLWVVANFKETQLEHMRPGQPVSIRIDAYPGRKFSGKVESIQTGAGARFSLFPPENATGNFIKVVQRVPVKIVFDTAPDPALALGPGMSVEPAVRVK